MTGAWPILKKDFASYYRSWAGVLVHFSFLFVAGIFFTLLVLSYSQISLQVARQASGQFQGVNLTRFVMGAFLLNLGVLFLFLTPLLSMRSLSEEKRLGTLELLYTYPLSDFEIVLGKYLALLSELVLLFLPTLGFISILYGLKAEIDWGIVVGGVLGFFLLGSTFLAIGLFFSSLTENQILAAGLTFLLLMVLWILEWVASFLPPQWESMVSALSPFFHFRDFSLGIIDLADTTYFLCAVMFFIFLTLRIVEARNWKG